ncbi:MAG: Rid family hydrolase [Gemmatimonadaceae bacterium]|jgi:reactive intermediate/imine deaminase|nr:Rid family hydrolase [Gemmatimonadaceae bacterium]
MPLVRPAIRLAAVLPLVVLGACSALQGTSTSAPSPAPGTGGAPRPTAPYEPARRAGNLLFLSGQLGTQQGSGDGVQGETRRAMEKVRKLVEDNGSTMDRVVKCNVFLADIAEWGAMNEVYVTFFPNRRPARTALAAGGIPGNGRVEIECIATVD